MKKLEGACTPTALQNAIGDPLRSEQRAAELLPRILSRVDLLTIFIAIVLFIPNASIVQSTQGAGSATYFYWVIGTITFLLPGAIVAGQLNRFMPVDGSIYVWTHRALDPLWGLFAGFCAWFPGILVLLASSDGIVTLVQGICIQIWGGQHWTRLAASTNFKQVTELDFVSGTLGWAISDQGNGSSFLLKTIDGGQTWTPISIATS